MPMRWRDWPATPGNDWLPWYRIVLNMLAFPLMAVAAILFWLAICLMWGRGWAKDFWDEWGFFGS